MSDISKRWRPCLMIFLVILVAGVARFRLREMPLERDEGEYAYAGQLILQGVPPYELACNMKLPGTYYAYALGMAVFGQTVAGIHLTLLTVNSLIILFVYLLGRRLFGVTAGLVAGAAYAVMSVSPCVLGMAAHANFFVILFAVPATLLMWRALETHSWKTLFGCGIFYGLAFLMKQQGVCFGLFGWAVYLLSHFGWGPGQPSLEGWSRRWGGAVRGSLVFISGMLLPVALTMLYLWWAGVFPRFWFWTFTYAHTYVTQLTWSEGLRNFTTHLKATVALSVGLWLLAGVGIVAGLVCDTFRKPTLFAVLLWLFSFLATAIGLYFREHYFILLLPAFAVLTGLAVSAAQETLRSHGNDRRAGWIPLVVVVVLLGWNVLGQYEVLFGLTPNQTCARVYPNNPFVEATMVAQYLRENASPQASLAVVGSEPEIFFYTRLHSATTCFYTYPLMEAQPYALTMQHEMMHEIESARPEYLVFAAYSNSWLAHTNSNLEILYWKNRYARAFYQRVGIVEQLTSGEIVCHWNEDAKFFDPANNHHFDIYRRKPE